MIDIPAVVLYVHCICCCCAVTGGHTMTRLSTLAAMMVE